MNADETINLLEFRRELWRTRLRNKNFYTQLGLKPSFSLDTGKANAIVDELNLLINALKGGE